VIELKHLTKQYGSFTAVSDLDLTLENGQIYGFLGPNGAGKSTTMNMMTGCLAPTSGTAVINGHDIFDDTVAAKKCIGYLPEIPPVYPDMTVREYLNFVAEAKRISRGEIKGEIDKAMDVTGIEPMKNRLIRQLSKGYRQRVGISEALLGSPEVIILDEPTVGLDPAQIIEIRELIRKLGTEHTVILSSHILTEVQACCSHIMIMAAGKLVASDTPENLERMFAGSNVLNISVRCNETAAQDILSGIGNISEISAKPSAETGCTDLTLTLSDKTTDIRDAIFFAFAEKRIPILSMSLKCVSLEDVFLELTANREREAEGKEKTNVSSIQA